MKKLIITGKRSNKLNEVKLVEDISKSFLEISPLQKEVFPSHKLQDHVYE